MDRRIARWGNSLALRIPRPVADRLGLAEGKAVELTVEASHLIVKPYHRELSLEELLNGITPENGFDDAPVGDEVL